MKSVFSVIVILFGFLGNTYAHADPTGCTLSEQDFQANIQADFNHFDQDLSNGGGGWRAIAHKGCYLESATLIETWHLQNLGSLQDWQDRILWWHAGQLYAMDNLYPTAIQRFQKAKNPNELPTDTFKWNAYADASIAFLKGDLTALKAARENLATAPDAQMNLKLVDAFIRCFGKPYSVAYDSNCGLN